MSTNKSKTRIVRRVGTTEEQEVWRRIYNRELKKYRRENKSIIKNTLSWITQRSYK